MANTEAVERLCDKFDYLCIIKIRLDTGLRVVGKKIEALLQN